MAELKQDIIILLDRLYNLKGEDNVLIKETETEIANELSRISDIETAIDKAMNDQKEQEEALTVFLQHKSIFETAFEGLTDESFSALRRIDVNLEIGTLMTRVKEKSPDFIQGLKDRIESIKRDVIDYESEKEAATNELGELRNKLSVHIDKRAQLVSLLEQSLSTEEIERESLTASFVKKVISSFEVFTIEEITRLTKLIMFPEDGLYDYDRTYEDRLAKGLIGLVDDESPLVNAGLGEEIAPVDEEVPVVEEPPVEESPAVQPVDEEEHVLEESPVEEHDVEEPVLEVPAPDEPEGPQVVLNFQQFEEADIDKILSGVDQQNDSKPNEGEEIPTEEEPPAMQPADEEVPVAEEIPTEEEPLVEQPVAEETPVEEEPPVEQPVAEETPAEEETPVEQPVAEEIPAEEETTSMDEFDSTKVEELLARSGLDINNFSKVNTTPLIEILKNIDSADEKLVERNYEILRSINLDDEAYKMRLGHMYITDVDFNKKITLLRAKSIPEHKIQAMIKETNSGLRIPYEELEERIKTIESLHGKVDESNIYLICKDISKYEENRDTLLRYGIDLDEKEARNYMLVLFESMNIPANSEILKDYIISILKSNGKYALSVFWKKPEELLSDIDDLIEAGLENIIATHPEILGTNVAGLIKRVKYCEANGTPVFQDDMRSEPYDYILKEDKFRKEFGYQTAMPSSVDKKQNNASLMEIIDNSDYIEILINTLDEYYSKTKSYATPELVDSMKERFEEFSHYLEDNAHAQLVGKYTYQVDGVSICKNKLERNLTIVLNTLAAANQPTLGVEKEIVLVSALYRSGLTKEELEKVVGACLGFNQAAQEVKL